jgi:hypothetical protein
VPGVHRGLGPGTRQRLGRSSIRSNQMNLGRPSTAGPANGLRAIFLMPPVLEHIEQPSDALKNIFSLLSPSGHIILTFSYSKRNYVKNVSEMPESSYGKGEPYIAQSYSRKEVTRWLTENNGVILEQEYWQFWEGEHWTLGKQVIPPRKVTADDRHQLTCVHMRKA